eukprot:scaffold2965_cov204-Skeletonema_marinoi.AAC.12
MEVGGQSRISITVKCREKKGEPSLGRWRIQRTTTFAAQGEAGGSLFERSNGDVRQINTSPPQRIGIVKSFHDREGRLSFLDSRALTVKQ